MNRLLLDTNTVVALLRGNSHLNDAIADAEWVGISVITKLEFLSFPGITKADEDLFASFESRVEVIDIANAQTDFLKNAVSLRKAKRVRMPDAIIVACAIVNRAKLLTADLQLLSQWPEHTMPLGAVGGGGA